jgi:hypothetical protein
MAAAAATEVGAADGGKFAVTGIIQPLTREQERLGRRTRCPGCSWRRFSARFYPAAYARDIVCVSPRLWRTPDLIASLPRQTSIHHLARESES